MDEGSGYCGSSGGIECVGYGEDREYGNDRRWRGIKSVLEKDSVESNMKPRFLAERLGIMDLVLGMKREGLTILKVC